MTPSEFWGTLFGNIFTFISQMYNRVYGPLISTILRNPILILMFGIIITSYIICFFWSIK